VRHGYDKWSGKRLIGVPTYAGDRGQPSKRKIEHLKFFVNDGSPDAAGTPFNVSGAAFGGSRVI
jgi:hypothetical protein